MNTANIKPRNIRVGNFNAMDVRRGMPDMDKFNQWSSEFLSKPELKDYDAYLWGAFPEKDNTKDIDVLLTQGEGFLPTTEEMEQISLMNLEESLVNNNMLVDLGFTDNKIRGFQDNMNIYEDTGKAVPTDGYVYGSEWFADGQRIKNRMDWKGPYAEQLPNNMVHLGGAIPYAKQLQDRENFDNYYSHKPVQIKERRKIYGQ